MRTGWMRASWHVLRVLFGSVYLVYGLNGFLRFMPVPPQSPEAQGFLDALYATGYMLPLWKTFEVAAGLLLVADRFVALALLLIAPITVNIFFFRLMLDRSLNPIGFILAAAQLFLMAPLLEQYRPLLRSR